MSICLNNQCITCVHNNDKTTLDCDYCCVEVGQTDGNGIVIACEDYQAEAELAGED